MQQHLDAAADLGYRAADAVLVVRKDRTQEFKQAPVTVDDEVK